MFIVLVGIVYVELNNLGGIGGLELLCGVIEIEVICVVDLMKKYLCE